MKKFTLILFTMFGLFMLVGCSAGPGKVVQRFFHAVEEGELTEAIGYLSKSSIQSMGEDKWRSLLTEATADLDTDGGIDKIDIVSEDITGEIAEVEVEFTYGDGTKDTQIIDMVKEDGDWKIQIDPFSK